MLQAESLLANLCKERLKKKKLSYMCTCKCNGPSFELLKDRYPGWY